MKKAPLCLKSAIRSRALDIWLLRRKMLLLQCEQITHICKMYECDLSQRNRKNSLLHKSTKLNLLSFPVRKAYFDKNNHRITDILILLNTPSI